IHHQDHTKLWAAAHHWLWKEQKVHTFMMSTATSTSIILLLTARLLPGTHIQEFTKRSLNNRAKVSFTVHQHSSRLTLQENLEKRSLLLNACVSSTPARKQ